MTNVAASILAMKSHDFVNYIDNMEKPQEDRTRLLNASIGRFINFRVFCTFKLETLM